MNDVINKLNARINRARLAKTKAEERLQSATEALEKAYAELEVAERLSGVGPGSVVKFAYGRGETRREELGTVIAVDSSSGVRYKVQTGEGFDAKLTVIFQAQVLEVVSNV